MTSDLHNPDVLSCLANLSNDEVFTPPKVVNDMLDLLPPELFRSSSTTFLDIGCKSGVFLREIAKRLIVGLADEMPDLQTRVDHILHHQLFGIATTELTSLVSRRTLYCSKYPNCIYSASRFETPEGNIRFRNIPHTFVNGRCKWCGASEDQFGTTARKGLETHAYEFIHTDNPKKIFNMKFDVIVGNPPYQIADGGGLGGSSAVPIYHMFVTQSMRLDPRYLTMIMPSRWFAGGKGLDEFRDMMIRDGRVRHLHDFMDAAECFPGVEIKGGVCYFLWDRDHAGDCEIVRHNVGEVVSVATRPFREPGSDVFIRYNEAVSIYRKTRALHEESFAGLVSPRQPFGFSTLPQKNKSKVNDVLVYVRGGETYCSTDDIQREKEMIDAHKVLISKAYNGGDVFPHQIINRPFVALPHSACSETYLTIGPFNNERICNNVISYIKTKFFRLLVLLRKSSQNAAKGVYEFVPLQDFSKPWTDAELYKKYKLTKDEIAFIESMIKPME